MENRYEEYYPEDTLTLPYSGREEYNRDLMNFLDSCLSFACRRKKEEGERFLFGVAAYAGQLEESLKGWKFGKEPRAAGEESLALFLMGDHRKSRCRLTEKKEILWYEDLCERFPMEPWEEFAFLLAMGSHLDRKYERLFAYLQDDSRALIPTFGLALSLFRYLFPSKPEKGKTADGAGLFGRLLEREGYPETLSSVYSTPLRVRREVLEFLGLVPENPDLVMIRPMQRELQGGLRRGLQRDLQSGLEKGAEEQSPSFPVQERQKDEIFRVLLDWKTRESGPGVFGGDPVMERPGFLHLWGEEGNGQRECLLAAASKAGISVVFANCGREKTMEETEKILEGAALKAKLFDGIFCLAGLGTLGEEQEEKAGAVSWAIVKAAGLSRHFVVISYGNSRSFIPVGLNRTEILFPLLTAPEKARIWEEEGRKYRLDSGVKPEEFANFYVLTADRIRGALETARVRAAWEGREEISSEDLRRAIAEYSPNELGRFALKKNAAFTWKDIVLEESQLRIMRHICHQFRFRDKVQREWGFSGKSPYGNGISAIFHGAPGTGKTMAVQVIASDLGLDLYRVDVSQLVSKYIGETEKNLSELFARAANINALLFFDEADGLFAKRSEVKDSHDRNANAETAHLLQMFEDYSGIVILATNYMTNVDEAFKRRIKFSLEFRLPDRAMREKLWNSILTEQVKSHSNLDIQYFAEHFELSGSGIKEVILNGAYMAAAEGRWPENRHMVEAMKLHYQKAGKLLDDGAFGYLGEGE